MNDTKKWYASKTFWINVIAMGFLIYQNVTGNAIEPQYQAMALAFVNIILRAITQEKLEW